MMRHWLTIYRVSPEHGLKLNTDKVRLRCSSEIFNSQVLTDKWLTPDLDKTKAIVNMTTPTTVKSIQKLFEYL